MVSARQEVLDAIAAPADPEFKTCSVRGCNDVLGQKGINMGVKYPDRIGDRTARCAPHKITYLVNHVKDEDRVLYREALDQFDEAEKLKKETKKAAKAADKARERAEKKAANAVEREATKAAQGPLKKQVRKLKYATKKFTSRLKVPVVAAPSGATPVAQPQRFPSLSPLEDDMRPVASQSTAIVTPSTSQASSSRIKTVIDLSVLDLDDEVALVPATRPKHGRFNAGVNIGHIEFDNWDREVDPKGKKRARDDAEHIPVKRTRVG
ncbi:hypothetical protein C8J56DRAFT_906351 [Mycena floridula]|nr:hypothetical protein C8J56DRAFT_906351 [Mycena floridula]